MIDINRCPGTLSIGFSTYSRTCLKRVFSGHKVSHILPYTSIHGDQSKERSFEENAFRISISGVQEKFSLIQVKNKLRLAEEGEQGTHILKPIPSAAKNADQMPANEHLTMQIAYQVFGIETAENAIIFFGNGEQAYITKRFDLLQDGSKLAQEDFASLAGKSPQTHGANYKYQGSYWDIFALMRDYLPLYKVESLKLFKLLVFNYLFSNGDAHLKNFSVVETPLGDFKLSPAYDLLNSRIHIEDKDFGMDDGLLTLNRRQGSIFKQFQLLADHAGIPEKQFETMMNLMMSRSDQVTSLIEASFLKASIQRNYLQSYRFRLKRLRNE